MAQPRRKKTSAQTSVVRVRQPHGGAINRGNPGNRGGIGVIPSLLRTELRGSFAKRLPIIEAIADGKPMQRTRVGLASILPHVVCANCGETQIVPKEPVDALLLEFDAEISASPKDRLAALDLQAKYGLGALKEISIENVRERVQGTLSVIRRYVPPELVQQMMPELRAQWA